MTPARLAELLDAAGLSDVEPGDTDALERVETAADLAPADGAIRAALVALHGWLTRDAGLAPAVHGVQREHLVRWDDTSTTWVGPRTDGRGAGMVRVLRPHGAKDPLIVRCLLREGRALRAVMPSVRLMESPPAAVVVDLPGPAYTPSPPGSGARRGAATRMWASSVASLGARARAGLGMAPLEREELRDAGDTLHWICLTLFEAHDLAPALLDLTRALRAWWPGADTLGEALDACLDATPATADEADALVRTTLATALAAERHEVAERHRAARMHDRMERLTRALDRLAWACPPPVGHGVVGVDLDAKPIDVASDGDVVHWRPRDGVPRLIVDPEGDLSVTEARRIIRARASAPVSATLNDAVGGDPAFVEDVVRWLSTALELRTLRMLIERA